MLTTTDQLALAAPPRPRASARPASAGVIDLPAVLDALRRRFWLIGGLAATAMAAVVLALALMTPRYTATAILIVDPRQQRVLSSEAVLSGIGADAAAVESQVEVLQSTSLARQVVEQLGLATDPELARPSLVERLSALVGRPGDASEDARLRRVMARFADSLRVRRRGLTYVLEVGFVSEDPVKAARIAQAVAQNYMAEQTAAKRQAASDASGWLGERLDDLRRRVTEAERAIATYRSTNNIVAVGEGRTLDERQVAELNQQLIFARARTAEARARLDQVGKASAASVGAGAIPEALQSAVIGNLRGQVAELARREAEITSTLGPRHPNVGTMRAQTADLRGQIEREIARVSAGVRNEFEVAQSRERSLERSLSDLKVQSARADQAAVRLRELEREAQAARTQLEQSLQRFGETSDQAALQRPDARILSAATAPLKPSEPKTMLVLLLGAAGALMLGVGAAAFAESLSRGYRTPRDVEAALSLPVLARLPMLPRRIALPLPGAARAAGSSGLSRYGVEQPLTAFGEAVRTVRRRLLNGEGRSQVVVVASSLPDEGKSTVAVNLAHSFAKSGLRTLLIDADVRKPSLPSEDSAGLVGLLAGGVPGERAVKLDRTTGLALLPVGPVADVAEAAELLGSPRMRALLDELRERFSVIILDAPPLLPVADTRELLDLADTALFVVEWNRTDPDSVGAALAAMAPNGHKVAGVLLNKVDARALPAYGYGYGGRA